MRRKSDAILMLLLGSLVVFFYNACTSNVEFSNSASSSSQIFETVLGNPLTGSQNAKTILQAVCQKISSCHSVAISDCERDVAAVSGIDTVLGLPPGTLNPYSTLMQADQSGQVTANVNAGDHCVAEISQMDCQSESVQAAYVASSSTPYAHVSKIFSGGPGSCPSVYLSPQIFRSVGPSNNKILACGSNSGGCVGQGSVTVAGSIATFTNPLAGKLGVGDVLVYDCNSDGVLSAGDCTAFVSSRIDSQHVRLQSADGQSMTGNYTGPSWRFYRAYTSLSEAIAGAGNENAALRALDPTLGKFEIFSSSSNNLISGQKQWNIAVYADGVDTTPAAIPDSWVTSAASALRIFAPSSSFDVGVSQRHSGVYSATSSNFNSKLFISADYVTLQGLQIHSVMHGSEYGIRIQNTHGESASAIDVIGNLIFMDAGSSGRYNGGVLQVDGNVNVINNILYDFTTQDATAYQTQFGGGAVYNNTIYNSVWGFDNNSPEGSHVHLKNNVTQACGRGFDISWSSDSDYNISSDAGQTTGAHDKSNRTVQFVNVPGHDFRLSSADVVAKGAGLDLSFDSRRPVTSDITGNLRKVPWDAGATVPY